MQEVIQSLLQARRYDFDVERAIYLTVLHRFCQWHRQKEVNTSVLAAVHDGLKVFQSATMQRIQPR